MKIIHVLLATCLITSIIIAEDTQTGPVTTTSPEPPARQKAIIVGASTGIGREVAKVLAQHGYDLGLCSRKIELLESLKAELPNTKIAIRQLDLMKKSKIQKTLQELVDELGGLDLIVVNSGIFPEEGGLLPQDRQIPLAWVRDTVAVNVTGCTLAFHFAINYFLKQNHGHIVGISSLDAVRGTAIAPTYSASKSFMAHFLEGMRNKFTQLHIPINVTEIRPGCIQTVFDTKRFIQRCWDGALPRRALLNTLTMSAGITRGGNDTNSHETTADTSNYTYWVVPSTIAAHDIYDAIVAKKKVAYTPRRWALIAALLWITPDWLYNKIGGF